MKCKGKNHFKIQKIISKNCKTISKFVTHVNWEAEEEKENEAEEYMK